MNISIKKMMGALKKSGFTKEQIQEVYGNVLQKPRVVKFKRVFVKRLAEVISRDGVAVVTYCKTRTKVYSLDGYKSLVKFGKENGQERLASGRSTGRLPQSTKALVLEAIKTGVGRKEILSKYGISQSTYWRLSRLVPVGKKHVVTLDEKIGILSALKNGERPVDIMEKFNIATATLYKYKNTWIQEGKLSEGTRELQPA